MPVIILIFIVSLLANDAARRAADDDNPLISSLTETSKPGVFVSVITGIENLSQNAKIEDILLHASVFNIP